MTKVFIPEVLVCNWASRALTQVKFIQAGDNFAMGQANVIKLIPPPLLRTITRFADLEGRLYFLALPSLGNIWHKILYYKQNSRQEQFVTLYKTRIRCFVCFLSLLQGLDKKTQVILLVNTLLDTTWIIWEYVGHKTPYRKEKPEHQFHVRNKNAFCWSFVCNRRISLT